MTDADEVASDIGLEHVVHLLGHDLQAQRLQSVMWVADALTLTFSVAWQYEMIE
jgi:hypothetical protein